MTCLTNSERASSYLSLSAWACFVIDRVLGHVFVTINDGPPLRAASALPSTLPHALHPMRQTLFMTFSNQESFQPWEEKTLEHSPFLHELPHLKQTVLGLFVCFYFLRKNCREHTAMLKQEWAHTGTSERSGFEGTSS